MVEWNHRRQTLYSYHHLGEDKYQLNSASFRISQYILRKGDMLHPTIVSSDNLEYISVGMSHIIIFSSVLLNETMKVYESDINTICTSVFLTEKIQQGLFVNVYLIIEKNVVICKMIYF